MRQQLVTLLVLIALPARAASAPGAGAGGVVVARVTHADAGRGLAMPEILATDSFTFGGDDNAGGLAARRVTFGCGHINKGIFQANETGIAGFGRGRWSLPSQLNVTSFSYCFTSMFDTKSSSVVTLGAAAAELLHTHHAAHTGDVRTTRLIKNPSQPSLYFVPLRGISVGGARVAVPESRLRSSTIIDSGASITTLPEDVYEAVKAEFVSQLPRGNYVFEDYAARVLCVVLDAAAGEQVVIGNYQQQNTHVVYDLENDVLSFAPARCDKLAASL
ncbi:hypothetical protein OsJ_20543 [Oryza sativa Japonica Group]|uniref:Peptidase A1 domain-containing protein n=1 Tax=Oryza sativa subsp. japonica TaxID=39947 RepID=B9FS43_ORYSJ|nr:hypothetical protein OsJ_20543 [Oryza sativa Japonica Group]